MICTPSLLAGEPESEAETRVGMVWSPIINFYKGPSDSCDISRGGIGVSFASINGTWMPIVELNIADESCTLSRFGARLTFTANRFLFETDTRQFGFAIGAGIQGDFSFKSHDELKRILFFPIQVLAEYRSDSFAVTLGYRIRLDVEVGLDDYSFILMSAAYRF